MRRLILEIFPLIHCKLVYLLGRTTISFTPSPSVARSWGNRGGVGGMTRYLLLWRWFGWVLNNILFSTNAMSISLSVSLLGVLRSDS